MRLCLSSLGFVPRHIQTFLSSGNSRCRINFLLIAGEGFFLHTKFKAERKTGESAVECIFQQEEGIVLHPIVKENSEDKYYVELV